MTPIMDNHMENPGFGGNWLLVGHEGLERLETAAIGCGLML